MTYKIEKVNPEFIGTLLESHEHSGSGGYVPIGQFYAKNESGTWTAVDNEDGQAWTEVFVDEDAATYWLESGISADELGFCDECEVYMTEGYVVNDMATVCNGCIAKVCEEIGEEVDVDNIFWTEFIESEVVDASDELPEETFEEEIRSIIEKHAIRYDETTEESFCIKLKDGAYVQLDVIRDSIQLEEFIKEDVK